MPRLCAFLVFATLLSAAALGQQPVFSPPRPAEAKPSPAPRAPGNKVGEKKSVDQPQTSQVLNQDPIPDLMAKLTRWPSTVAKEAANVLAGLGAPARKVLIEGLGNNDWRVQAGSAAALGEMGAKQAIEPLRKAIGIKSNRASLGVLMQSLVQIDPNAGSAAILPFVSHQSARVRRAALKALPDRLDESYLPEVLSSLRSRRTWVRAAGVDLLKRIPSAQESEEFFDALADPEVQVSVPAMRHLARIATPKVRARLLSLASGAPLRQATYAMLSLTMMEDEHQEAVIPTDGAISRRAMKLLTSDDPFYAGAAAIVLSNLSFRSSEKSLRERADKYLPPILIGTVAGGVFFSDYIAVEDLCWRKLALLSGRDLGQNGRAWKKWWAENRESFVARREMRGASVEDLKRARIHLVRSRPDGVTTSVYLSGDPSDLSDDRPSAPLVMNPKQIEALSKAFTDGDFFANRGHRQGRDGANGSLEIEIRIPSSAMSFRRAHYGPLPENLRDISSFIEETRRELAWQRLIPGDVKDRALFIQKQQAFFASPPSEEARDQRLRELALKSWSNLVPAHRGLALAVMENAPLNWRVAHREELSKLLRSETRLTEAASGLIALLHGQNEVAVRDAVVEVAAASPGLRSDRVLLSWLNTQPLPGVLPLMRDARARVRALAARSLGRFDGDPEVVGLLIQGLKDYEPDVQAACLESLSVMKDDRILAMLEAVVSGEDLDLRLRAVEALGRVGREQSVARLMELWRSGDRPQKYAVLRGLGHAKSLRSIVALTSIARETGPVELRREAIDILVRFGGKDVAERLADILERTPELGIKASAMVGLSKVMGDRALPTLIPYMKSQDLELARVSLLTIARLKSKAALPGLLAAMARPEGDMAAERAFQNLTFHVSFDPSPPRRHAAAEAWMETNKTLSREEWFKNAAAQVVKGLSPNVAWLSAPELSKKQMRALLPVLERGNLPLRLAIDEILRAHTGVSWAPMGTNSTDADERLARFRRLFDL